MQESLASQMHEWNSAVPIARPYQPALLAAFGRTRGIQQKVGLTFPFPEGPEVASSTMSETQWKVGSATFSTHFLAKAKSLKNVGSVKTQSNRPTAVLGHQKRG